MVLAVAKGQGSDPQTEAFVKFLSSQKAKDILVKNGVQ
jgi:ABC-type molybdate transport system substrate-binding protein